MHREAVRRRSVLAYVGALSVGGTLASSTVSGGESVDRDTFTILEGTEHETTGYVSVADQDGPTVFVIGGIHGDEEAGWVAAAEIADWSIEAGTVVTIPEANPTAIDAGTRHGADGTDLNRQFPTDEEPRTDLARAIWDVVLEYDPDVVIDLHESTGIYAGDPVDGVGQAIFRSYHSAAREAASRAVDYANEHYVDDSELEFMTGRFSAPNTEPEGLLVHKVVRELDTVAFLQETLRVGISLETRVHWQLVLASQLTLDWLLVDDEPAEDPEDEPDDGDPDDEDSEDEPDDEDPDDEDPEDEPDDAPDDEDPEDGTEDEDPDDAPEDEDPGDAPEDEDPGDETDDEDPDDAPDDEEPGDEADDEDPDDAPEDEDPDDKPDEDVDPEQPTARIDTEPETADERSLALDQIIELDASGSDPGSAPIESYQWDLGDDGTFDTTGASVEVTIAACGDFPVVLCVRNEDGLVDESRITLSTA